jgi:hypothetical protein
MDIGTFMVQRAIIHQIPKARLSQKAESPPTLSELPSELDRLKISYFQNRIRRSLGKSFAVQHDPGTASPAPAFLLDFFSAQKDRFVEVSRAMALHLHAIQGGSSSAGLLAVVEGTITSGTRAGKCLAVLKLEMEPGVRVEHILVNGKSTFQVEIEEVTLTETTRVFKAGVFPRFSDLTRLSGLVSDEQLDPTVMGREIAEFFLSRFLGCALAASPRVETKRYLEMAEGFLNRLDSDEKKLRYQVSIQADLLKPSDVVDPEGFAREHLDEDDRDLFLAPLRTQTGQVLRFRKDNELIRTRVGRSLVELDNGVHLSGPSEAVKLTVRAIEVAVDPVTQEPIVRARIRKVS